MFNENDIYTHLINGGKPEDLHKILNMEIEEVNKKVQTTLELEKKEKELAEKKDKARTSAFKALKSYFALVNPDITEDIINSVLDALESIEIKINRVRGKRANSGCLECLANISKEDIDVQLLNFFLSRGGADTKIL